MGGEACWSLIPTNTSEVFIRLLPAHRNSDTCQRDSSGARVAKWEQFESGRVGREWVLAYQLPGKNFSKRSLRQMACDNIRS